ncbi:addiction module antitoxin RelB [Brevundimonas nasdae]|uniref:Addiction module antitoxin RelB n=1 Tax=Brevundimonas nasdae TaxID=172043 RepID=A0A0B4CVE0_9CAUL|nr:type II toxin-antitoxin system RelE/ParE family toxin [Brevundimonas nasdae]KIC60377.1 addiction module antitoxin RelB [Brevundimonas nasdae]
MSDNAAIKLEFAPAFDRWLLGLRDQRAAARIATRLERLSQGHWGDVKPVGEGVSELRIAYGPGYRLYALKRNKAWVILLAGGDKSSQNRDIFEAKRLAKEYGNG